MIEAARHHAVQSLGALTGPPASAASTGAPPRRATPLARRKPGHASGRAAAPAPAGCPAAAAAARAAVRARRAPAPPQPPTPSPPRRPPRSRLPRALPQAPARPLPRRGLRRRRCHPGRLARRARRSHGGTEVCAWAHRLAHGPPARPPPLAECPGTVHRRPAAAAARAGSRPARRRPRGRRSRRRRRRAAPAACSTAPGMRPRGWSARPARPRAAPRPPRPLRPRPAPAGARGLAGRTTAVRLAASLRFRALHGTKRVRALRPPASASCSGKSAGSREHHSHCPPCVHMLQLLLGLANSVWQGQKELRSTHMTRRHAQHGAARACATSQAQRRVAAARSPAQPQPRGAPGSPACSAAAPHAPARGAGPSPPPPPGRGPPQLSVDGRCSATPSANGGRPSRPPARPVAGAASAPSCASMRRSCHAASCASSSASACGRAASRSYSRRGAPGRSAPSRAGSAAPCCGLRKGDAPVGACAALCGWPPAEPRWSEGVPAALAVPRHLD